jgi:hypothetical protein
VKPVYQTVFGERGNCLQASVASLLELPLEAVPHWVEEAARPGQWYTDFNNWFVREYRLVPHIVGAKTHYPPEGVYCLAWGKSARGLDHSVVYKNAEIVHDPHPEGGGLVDIEQFVVFVATFRQSEERITCPKLTA